MDEVRDELRRGNKSRTMDEAESENESRTKAEWTQNEFKNISKSAPLPLSYKSKTSAKAHPYRYLTNQNISKSAPLPLSYKSNLNVFVNRRFGYTRRSGREVALKGMKMAKFALLETTEYNEPVFVAVWEMRPDREDLKAVLAGDGWVGQDDVDRVVEELFDGGLSEYEKNGENATLFSYALPEITPNLNK
jgi:hypothetical protein